MYALLKQRMAPISSAIEIRHFKMACTNCLKQLQSGERINIAECNHLFCTGCIVEAIGKFCPLCGSRVYVDEVKRILFVSYCRFIYYIII